MVSVVQPWLRVAVATVAAVLMLLGEGAAGAGATTFYVTNNLDSGQGSLRQAILDANAAAVPGSRNTITVPAGASSLVIDPASRLPAIRRAVSLTAGGMITIDDTRAGEGAVGLKLAAGSGGSAITGVTITGSAGEGILVGSSRNLIAASTIGSLNAPNQTGIVIESSDNRIGGTSASARNLISGNNGDGVLITGSASTGNVVQGNFIGANPTGRAALPNANGVGILAGASRNTVGGTVSGSPNLISGNRLDGVLISGTGTMHNSVLGNAIGLQINGIERLSNTIGVALSDGATINGIGGAVVGAGNTFAYNELAAVVVDGAGTGGNQILRNSMRSDGSSSQGPGIELTDGGNANELSPVIGSVSTSSTATTISGTGAPGSRIEVFFNPNCNDPEGEHFLTAATTTPQGSWTTTVRALAEFNGVTATQTDPSTLNTSDFSSCVTPR